MGARGGCDLKTKQDLVAQPLSVLATPWGCVICKMEIQLFIMLFCLFADTFQALIEYSDPIAAQTAKVVSIMRMSFT